MGAFTDGLQERAVDATPERWVYVPYDQLTRAVGPASADGVGLVLVESRWKARRRPYRRQKLALILANQRHFALEALADGVPVRYLTGAGSPGAQLREAAGELGDLVCMRPAERELRHDLASLIDDGLLSVEPHEGWLTTAADFAAAGDTDGPWRMDAFYRAVRQRTGILMDDGSPAGGRYSHDADNRERWSGDPAAPEPPVFEPDAVTLEVADLVESAFADHPGRVRPAALPATAADAEALWSWALAGCMEHFGPYEDAMSANSQGLFHTRVAPLLNLHRLLPHRVVSDVLDLDIPLNSKEGFVRQVLGWREFVRHVHDATDGFRSLPHTETADRPGDGGYGRWRGEPWDPSAGPDGGARGSVLDADGPLPAAWWGQASGLRCLDTVVGEVMEQAWTHHIPRLMVLSNLGALLDVSPRELTDWFWVAFVDAYDWVVEPNVLAMGTYGAGDLMTTKPYVSGAPYIDRMSDYCSSCAFHPKRSCPVTPLYWGYLGRHREALAGNRRMNLPLASERKRSDEQKAEDARVFRRVRKLLDDGERLTPDALAED
ncbi:MAG: cryptochrome/photolyase family protein [Longimicrobiales bacterium]